MARKKRYNFRKIFRTKDGKFKYSVLIWCVLAIWAVYIIISQQIDLTDKNRQISEISEKIDAAEKEHRELTETRDSLESDEYIEDVARKNHGYAKSNEQVFVDSSKSKQK